MGMRPRSIGGYVDPVRAFPGRPSAEHRAGRAHVKPGFEFPSLPRSQIPHSGRVLNRSPVSNSPGSQGAGLGEGMVKTPARFLSLSR